MDRKERIVGYMKSEGYVPLKPEELMAVLCVPEKDREEFFSILNELVFEGKVMNIKNNRLKATDKNVVTGILRCSRRGFFGFVETGDSLGDVFISGEKLADAIDGDFVAALVDVKKVKDNMREGHILKVLERRNMNLTGVIIKEEKEQFLIKPDNSAIFSTVTTPVSDLAKKGERVLINIEDYLKNGDIKGAVALNLGKADDFKSCIEAAIYKYNIRKEFLEETLFEAERIAKEKVEVGKRRDLREMLIFTIDGDDARDFDDAVSLEELKNGNFRLGVHIADVTHYVKDGSALDNEAFFRGTSVYLADRVIPMLPKILSNGICSLNPYEDRFTLTVFMEIDKEGMVLSHELLESVICSKERLTYNIASELLEGENEELKIRYKNVLPTLEKMKKVAFCLNKKRERRGSINFDFPEAKIIVDEEGYPVDIKKEERTISHKIIEEFMLVANETIAEYAFWSEIPFVYRVHESPSAEKMESFQKFIFNFGLTIKGRTDKEEGIHPKVLQKILDSVKGKEEETLVSEYMLRSLMKAEYRAENLGHFGLAAKYYCHFTSPIRRYPDLMIHRILKDFLNGKNVLEYEEKVLDASKHSSKTERDAEMLERDVDDLMKAQFMSEFIGEYFRGKVSGVTKFGIFVELENTVEGLVRLENMNDDFYVYDEEKKMVVGKRRKNSYKIGDDMEVLVAKCNILTGEIDFLPKDAGFGDINRFYKRQRKAERERSNRRNYGGNKPRNRKRKKG